MEDRGGALTVVTRLARPHVLVVLAAVIAVPAFLVRHGYPGLAAALGAAAVLLVVLGGRTTQARLHGGRVTVRPASPFERGATRPLQEFVRVSVETLGEARARRADERARAFVDRSGGYALPDWARPRPAPGTNDHLRRVVLVPRAGEPLPVTAWLAQEDDLEAARSAVEARLG